VCLGGSIARKFGRRYAGRPFDDDATAERCLRREFLLPDFDIDDVPMLGN